MNSKTFISIVAFAILGLLVGYGLFGKLAGDYVSIKTLFSFGGNALQNAFHSISGIEEMRNRILICGAAGAVAGLLVSLILKKK
jgi:hypothetical protein